MTYYCGTFEFMFVSFNAVAVSKGRRHIGQTQNNYRASVILELTLLKISSGLNRHVDLNLGRFQTLFQPDFQ